MGRKPVFGLVGACLASVALTGGCQNGSTGSASVKKDTPSIVNNNTRTTGSDQGWRNPPSSTAAGGNAFSSGTTVGTSGGTSMTGLNSGVRPTAGGTAGSPYSSGGTMTGATGAYPEGRSVATTPTTTGTGGTPAYPGTTSNDLSGSRSTVPTNFNDSAMSPGLARPAASTLPPLPGPGAAMPRIDNLPPSSGPGSTMVRPPSGLTPAAAATTTPSSGAAVPPPVPAVSDAPAAGSGPAPGDLPPIPPPSSQSYQKAPLPTTPTPRMGVPALPQNPATMQNN